MWMKAQMDVADSGCVVTAVAKEMQISFWPSAIFHLNSCIRSPICSFNKGVRTGFLPQNKLISFCAFCADKALIHRRAIRCRCHRMRFLCLLLPHTGSAAKAEGKIVSFLIKGFHTAVTVDYGTSYVSQAWLYC